MTTRTPPAGGLGHYGEQLAAKYLLAAGLVILDRHWRGPLGELDLVVRDGTTLVFVEVQSQPTTPGPAAEAVRRVRSARIRRCAAAWLSATDRAWPAVRYDLVVVSCSPTEAAVLDHRRGVL